jgi:transposase
VSTRIRVLLPTCNLGTIDHITRFVYICGVSRPWTTRQPATALLPVTAADLLPADHPALFIQQVVNQWDLFTLDRRYRADGAGRPPYEPKMMLTLLLYCRSKRLFSSRQVEAACYDDLGARVITGNRYPDWSTIDRFFIQGAGQ